MTRHELAVQLMHDYNYYRAHTRTVDVIRKRQPYNDLKVTPARIKLLEILVDWCGENNVDPRLWLYHLFECRRWMAPPRLAPGHLFSKNLLVRYPQAKATQFFTRRLQETERTRRELEGLNYDPNLQLTEGVETLKRTYARCRAWTRCLDDMRQTYGYHPRSEVCGRCPLVAPCEKKLRALFPFDIVAARKGDLPMTTRLAQETVWRTPPHAVPSK